MTWEFFPSFLKLIPERFDNERKLEEKILYFNTNHSNNIIGGNIVYGQSGKRNQRTSIVRKFL